MQGLAWLQLQLSPSEGQVPPGVQASGFVQQALLEMQSALHSLYPDLHCRGRAVAAAGHVLELPGSRARALSVLVAGAPAACYRFTLPTLLQVVLLAHVSQFDVQGLQVPSPWGKDPCGRRWMPQKRGSCVRQHMNSTPLP